MTIDKPNIILLTLESTRADHLPCYGYRRNTTPNICKLAEDGVLFENAIAQSSWTHPSLPSLLTSKYPSQLGVLETNPTSFSKLSEDEITLAEYLKNKSYRTYAIVWEAFTGKYFNLDQGFDIYRDKRIRSREAVKSSEKFLRSNGSFFLWIHFLDPHQGYNPPANFSGIYSSNYSSNISSNLCRKAFRHINFSREDIAYIRARYDEELKYADFWIGNFLEELKKRDLYEESLIVVTADHGEDLMEHGSIGHGLGLWDNLIHVPLIIKFPRGDFKGIEISEPVGLIDLFPTVSDILGDRLNKNQGASLIKMLENKNVERKGIVSQYAGSASLRTKNWHFIYSKTIIKMNETDDYYPRKLEKAKEELYNLRDDPNEKNNIAEKYPYKIVRFEKILNKTIYEKSETDPNESNISKSLKERLENLGYLK